jgi:hypothetical protein
MKEIVPFFIRLCAFIFISAPLNIVQAQNTISDTINILHYTVKLNITDFTTDTIRGGTTLKFTPVVNGVTTLPLDLLHKITIIFAFN